MRSGGMGESIWADEERAGGDGSIRHLAPVDGTSSPLVVMPGWVASRRLSMMNSMKKGEM
jgi:hypothetical protein